MRCFITLVLVSTFAYFLDLTAVYAVEDRPLVEKYLLQGELAEGEQALSEHVKENPDDQQARFGLGALQFLRGVERLAQSNYKFGVTNGVASVPFLRLDIPKNPAPAEVTYEEYRQVLTRFVADLREAEETLEKVDTVDVKMPIQFAKIRLDLDGNGEATEGETLWRIYVQFNRRAAEARGMAPALEDDIAPAVEVPEGAVEAVDEGDVRDAAEEAAKEADVDETEEKLPEVDLPSPKPVEGATRDRDTTDEDAPEEIEEVAEEVRQETQEQTLRTAIESAADEDPRSTDADALIDGEPAEIDVDPEEKAEEDEQSEAGQEDKAADEQQQLEEQAKNFTITFDGADVHWLRGYCHLLQALANVALAHDSEELFNQTAHLAFPKAKTPYPYLKRSPDDPEFGEIRPYQIVDAIAAIHLLRLEVVQPKRMQAARLHLLAMTEQSRLSWERIQGEMDDDREWIPSPEQTGVIPGVEITQEMIDTWHVFLDEWDALLKGERLVPFWRGDKKQGINLKRVFDEPRQFDLVLWIQGTAAQPYLEDGELTKKESWQRLVETFGGNFVGFALYFN